MSGRQHKETELARRTRARGLAVGRSTPLIAEEVFEECAPHFGTTRIKSHRLAHGIALADVVEQVRALFERDGKPVPGIGETLLSAYESGLKRPGPEYLHYLCSVYRVEPAALGYDGPCICGHGHRMPGVVRGGQEVKPDRSPESRELWIKPLSDPSSDGGEEDENVLRRTLLAIIAGSSVSLNESMLGAADSIRRRMDDTLVSTTVSPAMLDHWEESTTAFGRQYMNTPPMRQLCDVTSGVQCSPQAMERHQPVDLQERLCRLAAQLAGLSGMIMIDLGDHRMARSFFSTRAGRRRDRRPRAAGLGHGQGGSGPALLRRPARGAEPRQEEPGPGGADPVRGSGHGPGRRGPSAGDAVHSGGKKDVVDQAKRALSRARAAFSQMAAARQDDADFGYTERQLYFHQGDALVKLGQAMEADLILEQALTKYGRRTGSTRPSSSFDRAQCNLLEGDVRGGAAMAQEPMRPWVGISTPTSSCSAPTRWPRPSEAKCGDLPGLQDSIDARSVGGGLGPVGGGCALRPSFSGDIAGPI